VYSVASSTVSLAAVVSTLRMEAHLLAKFDRGPGDARTYATVLRAAYLAFLPIASIAVAAVLVFASGNIRIVGLLAIAEVAIAPLQFPRVALQVHMRQRAMFTASLISRGLWAVSVVVLVASDRATVVSVITTRLITTFIECLALHHMAGLSIIGSLAEPVPRSELVAVLRQSLPLAATGLTGEAYTRLDQPIIAALRGSREVGLYAGAVRLVDLTGIHAVVVQGIVAPGIMELQREGDRPGVVRGLRDGLLLTLIPGGLLLAPAAAESAWITRHVLGPSYGGSADMLAVLAIAEWITFVGTAYSTVLLAEWRRATLLWANVVGVVLNVAINLLFIRRFGGIAAAWASVIGYGAASAIMATGSASLRSELREGMWLLVRCAAATGAGVAACAVTSYGFVPTVVLATATQLAVAATLLPNDAMRLVRFLRRLERSSGAAPTL
jgi:O-antigen/teichoic acid export membrane protein